jgi:large subunit ribosomal protein L9
LFGSIAEHDIVEAVKTFTGIEVDRKIITIDTPIKEIGLHEVTMKPHPEVEFKVTLDVIPA